ncbi:cytochrome P450 family protein [Saccharothrix coeruleofusca]|uniref:Cytochrome P450 n=1 Tax=Saccharothrix coeruleofusca TaxID=33919 RepID=A0A918ASX7_9PSEU|nr:cytochrome P450 [Saccharothrix coeruleofusca]MBP2335563.1 cytochrome P450 [Saccharothrix coeruleofusca]GGP79738.1 cytochrome P450 [Saccharothrix coeruleofusca]
MSTEAQPGVDHETLPPEFFTDPAYPNGHADNARLRDKCPVHRVNHPIGAEAYVVMDYETVAGSFTDPRLSKSVDNAPAWWQDLLKDSSPTLIRNMLTADPPRHTRLRKLVAQAFTPRKMKALRPRIQQTADDLIDAFSDGRADLFTEFAITLPLKVICEFLGVPFEDRDKLQEWGLLLSGAPYATEEENRRLKWASDSIEEYLKDLLAARRAGELGDDLVSTLIRAADEDGRFTDDELVSTLILLINAGHKTTAYTISNGMEALFANPDQLELLRANPDLAPSAIEEFLRYQPPVYRGTLRVAAQDMELAGVRIAKESFVHLMISSANRDPKVFPDPDRLDITRTGNRHFSFGHGAHFCPGSPLSRLEGEIAFNTLLRRLPDIALAVPREELPWLYDNSVGRGVNSLPITYTTKLPR